jgi:hypothetical protein
MITSKNKHSIKLIIFTLLSFFSVSVYAQASGDCILMQSAANGILQKNGTNYELKVTKADPWLIYFNHLPNGHLDSAKFITKNQFYKQMQQSCMTNNSHAFNAEIIAFRPNNTAMHYYAFINKVKYYNHSDQINYQLSLPVSNNSAWPVSKINLKHVVILINGNDICVNCGGPW